MSVKSTAGNSASILVASAAASILTSLAIQYIDRRWRWRSKCRKLRHAFTLAKTNSTHLHLMMEGKPYDCDEVHLSNYRDAAHELVAEYNVPGRIREERTLILQSLLGSCGSDICIEPPFYIDYGRNLHVGNNFYANFNVTILDCAPVTIGDNVFLAPGVHIYTATHPLDAIERRSVEFAKPVTIGDDVWIGGGAIILPGVRIGNRVVIAAGAVVTADIDDDVMVGGVPARVIKKLR